VLTPARDFLSLEAEDENCLVHQIQQPIPKLQIFQQKCSFWIRKKMRDKKHNVLGISSANISFSTAEN
jgi:hypothetical protein